MPIGEAVKPFDRFSATAPARTRRAAVATGDAEYLAAAEKGLGYLRRHIIDCPTAPTAACVLEDDEIKLGGNGLALLALSKYMAVTGSRGDLSLAQRP